MKTLIVIFLLVSFKMVGQNDSIKASEIDKIIWKRNGTEANAKKFAIIVDSINLNVAKYIDRYNAKTHLKKNETKIELDFYLKDDELIKAVLKEFNPKNLEAYHFYELYYDKGKLIHIQESYTWSTCIGIPIGKDLQEYAGYNKEITKTFARELVSKSVIKILNHR